jgi:hypothetical protein
MFVAGIHNVAVPLTVVALGDAVNVMIIVSLASVHGPVPSGSFVVNTNFTCPDATSPAVGV